MAEKKFIGIRRLWYGDVINTELTTEALSTWLETATEVHNSHDGTFSYTQDDPEVTEYKNELSGNTYYREKTTNGTKTISFAIGEYDLQTKADLQGGSVITEDSTTIGWAAPTSMTLVNKAVVALCKTGHYVVFTNAGIVGKTEVQEKNMTLGVTATAMDNPTVGVKDEYWFYGTSVTAPQAS